MKLDQNWYTMAERGSFPSYAGHETFSILVERFMSFVAGLTRPIGRVLRQARIARIAFNSGLGDSANLLYGLVRSMKPETCVEIGSARGKSACYIGIALAENGSGRLYAIDPHRPTKWNDAESVDTFKIIQANLAALGLSERVTIVRATSEEASRDWRHPIDLLFIDGDHSYEGVRHDWDLFVPYVKPFGIVVFHDTAWEIFNNRGPARPDMGVPRFVDELREAGYPVLTIDRDYGLSLVQPTPGGRPLRQQAAAAKSIGSG
jgi:predicted O-methyltransferase YrrM